MKVSDEVVFLEEAFDILNQRFFESVLSRPAITIQSTPGAHGHFTPYDAWDDSGLKLKEINLGAESLHRAVQNVIATLMHEMIHYWCHVQGFKDTSRGNTYHNKRFKEETEKRGLVITVAPRIGYSVTQPAPELLSLVRSLGWEDKLKLYRNPKMKKESGKDGGFDSAGKSRNDMPSKSGNDNPGDDSDTAKPTKKKSSTRKYICPKCGLSVRATKVVRIACMDCGNIQMEEEPDKNL